VSATLAGSVRAASAPTPTLLRKRGREQSGFAEWRATTTDRLLPAVMLGQSNRHCEPPLPLVGEGWGGGATSLGLAMDDPKKPRWTVATRTRQYARALRRNQTDAERLLWAELRDHRLGGAGFRRPVPIDGYIADFVCHAAKLVVELDGGQHFSDTAERADAARSAVIERRGFVVLRFANHDVMTNRAGVLDTIAAAIASRAPTPTLPRERGREQGACAVDAPDNTNLQSRILPGTKDGQP
jgi:very-short-patch-repair endonuclease